MKKDITIMGAGLAGSLMSIYMAKRDYSVKVYEKRPDMRKEKISVGKSINLALSERGIQALDRVGLKEKVLEMCIPMYARMIHDSAGNLKSQSYSHDGKSSILSVSRGGLNMVLMDEAEKFRNVEFIFDSPCQKVDLRGNNFTVKGEKTPFELIFGCDGAFSSVRSAMTRVPGFNYSQSYLKHGYKELSMPANPDGSHKMEKEALHIWPRGEFMLIALPNLDGTFTCTMFLPFQGENGFSSIDSSETLASFFEKYFPDVPSLIPDLETQYFTNPSPHLVTVRCDPWRYNDKAVLIGDSAHAVVPFFGQGMNCAFEDCRVLDECIEEGGGNWENILSAYDSKRISNANAIADMAIENFTEMRDSTGDPKWLERKELEHFLADNFPDHYMARYELVSFSNIPYREAYDIGERNDRILDYLINLREKGIEMTKENILPVLKGDVKL